MIYDSPHLYRLQGLELGIPGTVLDNAIRQIAVLRGANLAPILTLGHLARRIGAPHGYLRAIIERRIDPYEQFSRKRRDGHRMRIISAPTPVLMSVQRWILQNILSRVDVHHASFAYTRGRSVAACARRHVGARFLLKFDLHNFFESINELRVYSLYRGLGYAPLVSLELSRLCTRGSAFTSHRSILAPPNDKYVVVDEYRSKWLGFVPQGSPTSGAIANLVARQLDNELQQLAEENRLSYTRYADDMMFSGAGELSRSLCRDIVRKVRGITSDNGFQLHEKKTRIVSPGARLVVLGVVLGTDGISLSREIKQRIERHLYGAERFHVHNHANHFNFTSVIGFINHIRGLLDFAHDVDPVYAAPRRERWNLVMARDAASFLREPIT